MSAAKSGTALSGSWRYDATDLGSGFSLLVKSAVLLYENGKLFVWTGSKLDVGDTMIEGENVLRSTVSDTETSDSEAVVVWRTGISRFSNISRAWNGLMKRERVCWDCSLGLVPSVVRLMVWKPRV